jgi:site-specific recombinase XerD
MRIEEYKTHLTTYEKLSAKTILEHCNNIKRFCLWATQQNYTSIDNLTYLELLNFVKHCKEGTCGERSRTIKIQTIKLRLNSINKYYEYLKHIGIIERNPVKKIKLKGEQKTITQNIFTYTELEQLYNEYLQLKADTIHSKIAPYAKQRNNVLLSLMLWQGVKSGEAQKLTLQDINLNEGTINIPKLGRGASRQLKLHPNQIIQFYKYINETLPYLQSENNHYNNKPSIRSKSLLIGEIGGASPLFNLIITCSYYSILQQLKGINQKVHDISQLRTSIIIHWIKVYGKRQAQYMAGHKHILSTERYELQELDSLTDSLLRHHPLN